MPPSPLRNRVDQLATLLATSPHTVARLAQRVVGHPAAPELYYVVPKANWVIDWVGHYIVTGIQQQYGWPTHLTSAPHLLVDHIIHYGEVWAFLNSIGKRHNQWNTLIATVFHASKDPEFPDLNMAAERIIDHADLPTRIVTACTLMADRLHAWGIPSEKIVHIPLGVDTSHFRPTTPAHKQELRRQLDIPADALCIGSFQKDGDGWGEGLIPKLIKGPDLFLDVIKRVHRHHKLFVLLTAPARGYVTRGLDELGVPYSHHIVDAYPDVVRYYHCLDLYLVTSREEGGPKAIVESHATGTPIISTRVGMAPDVIEHGQNGLLADVGDVDRLAEQVAFLAEHPEKRQESAANGLAGIHQYDWQEIASRYYREIYAPLLNTLSPTSTG